MIYMLVFGMPKWIYQLQITIITSLLILLLNIAMIVFYFQYAGMPYLSPKHYNNILKVG